jgi:hypothetical protein
MAELEYNIKFTGTGGQPVIKVPPEIMRKATEDPTSPEGIMVAQLKEQMMLMKEGHQGFTILPSDWE